MVVPVFRAGCPRVTHPFAAVLTPEGAFSLDLHVLSTPPAFVLSQDQTLREENRRCPTPRGREIRTACLPERRGSRRTDGATGFMSNLAIAAAGRVPGRNACCSVFKDRGDRERGRPIDPISTFAAPGSSEAPSAGAKSAPYAGVSMGGRSKRWCLNRVLSV